MIHPTDLRRRRQRCRLVVERLAALERAPQTACNTCGCSRKIVLAGQDRYGVAVRTALCPECGLVYLLEPLTPEGYAEFYASGSYREITGLFSRRQRSMPQIRAGQVDYAARVFGILEPHLRPSNGGRLLDIGASTGLVADRFRQHLGFDAVILDPAASEIRQPETRGMERVTSSFEDYETDERYSLILLCRTVEHLLDLRLSLEKVRELLTPDGVFFCDIADFFEICRLEGPPEVVSKLDHCFWLTQETAQVIFRRLGLEVVAIHAASPYDQLSFVLRRGDKEPEAQLPPGWIDTRLRRLREIGSDWQIQGRRALDPIDWLRRRGYRLKRRFASRGGA